jgi:CRP-like cAMP-binding protein
MLSRPFASRESMSLPFQPVFDRLMRKLERRVSLEASDREAVASLGFTQRTYEQGSFIVREGAAAEECGLILDGFAFRQKLTRQGNRQIVSFHIPGDFVDLEGSMLKVADHNVEALTCCEIAAIPIDKIIALIDTHPRVGRALWIETLIDASIYREWVLNVGRRPAQQRLAHLFCEFAKRLNLADLGDENGFVIPMTQEELADAAGITPVHVNRSLKALDEAGLIVREGRFLRIPDFERLRHASDFNELYLHLDETA